MDNAGKKEIAIYQSYLDLVGNIHSVTPCDSLRNLYIYESQSLDALTVPKDEYLNLVKQNIPSSRMENVLVNYAKFKIDTNVKQILFDTLCSLESLNIKSTPITGEVYKVIEDFISCVDTDRLNEDKLERWSLLIAANKLLSNNEECTNHYSRKDGLLRNIKDKTLKYLSKNNVQKRAELFKLTQLLVNIASLCFTDKKTNYKVSDNLIVKRISLSNTALASIPIMSPNLFLQCSVGKIGLTPAGRSYVDKTCELFPSFN